MSKRKIVILSNIIFITIALLGVFVMAFFISPKSSNPKEPIKKVLSLDVTGYDELKSALAQEGDKEITLKTDVEVPETLSVSGNVTFTTEEQVTFKRSSEFEGNVFEVVEGGSLNISPTSGKIVFDGQEQNCDGQMFLNDGTLTLGENVEIKNCKSYNRGSVVYNNGTLTIDGAEIHNNTLEEKEGGAVVYGIVYNFTGSKFYFNSGKFYSNTSYSTGMLFVHDGAVAEFNGGEIYSNSVTGLSDSVIYIRSADATFKGVKIHDNQGGYGPIATNYDANVILDGCEITGNHANSYGGAIYMRGNTNLLFKSGKIDNNTSAKSGGAIFIEDFATFTMEGGEIKGNRTEANGSNGGAIVNKSVTNIKGGTIEDNQCTGMGGAIISYLGSNQNPKLIISGGRFVNNKAIKPTTGDGHGGAIHCVHEMEITGGEFEGNSSESNGGAIYVGTNCNGKIKGATFRQNKSNANGGAIYCVTNCVALIEENTIENNQAAVGGGVYAYSTNVTLKNNTISSNTATSNGGGVAFSSAAVATLEGNTIQSNTAVGGGGLFTESRNLTLSGDTITENTSTTTGSNGGGGILFHSDSKASSVIKLNNVTVQNNTINTKSRGKDIYAWADNSNSQTPPILEVTDGTFGHVAIQYAVLKIGGDVHVSESVEFNASTQPHRTYIEIVKEIENEVTIKHNYYSNEKESTTATVIRYVANDPWSNIYSQARKLKTTNAGYVFNVLNDKILLQTKTFKVDVSATDMAIDAPMLAANGSQVSFKALKEYSISNVKVSYDNGGEQTVDVQEDGGTYTFTMPEHDVTISYEDTKLPLTLEVEEGIADTIDVNETYTFKENVEIVVKSQYVKKLTSLKLDLGNGQQIDMLDSLTFKMFKGAKLLGTTENYHNVSYVADEKISNFNFVDVDLDDDTNKAYETQTVKFTFDLNLQGDDNRYVLKEVYYLSNTSEKIIINAENNIYSFTMPTYDVQIQFTFENILSAVDDAILVGSEQELIAAASENGKVIVVYKDITLNQTIVLSQGEYQIIGINNAKVIRGEGLTKSLIELGFRTTLSLGMQDEIYSITFDGNSENAAEVNSSLISCYDGGVLNVYDGVLLCNNTLADIHYLYSERAFGNESSGGGAIFNHYGQVNVYGGEISGNKVTGKIAGGGIFNYGTLNIYGGVIKENSAQEGNGGGIYNGRSLTIEGGSIENNTITGNGYGAGVYVATSKYAHVFMRDGFIKNNSSQRSGAGLFVSSLCSVFINGGTFEGNSSTVYNGGAINSRGNLYIYGGTFKNNSAKGTGGAIYQYSEAVQSYTEVSFALHGGTFENNSAANGGAIGFGDGSKPIIDGGSFSGNQASNRGGAIYLIGIQNSTTPTTLTLTGGTFTNNSADKQGDAIAIQYSVLNLGGDVTIDGEIEFVANTTENYAYINFISNFEDGTKFTIKPISYTSEANLGACLKFSEGVDGQALLNNIQIENSEYGVKVEDDKLVIYSLAGE